MLVKEIRFYLENCDLITIDGKYIGDFHVGNIQTEIKRIACNAINEVVSAHDFAIEIGALANGKYQQLGTPGKEYTADKFERLSENDITQIDFILYDPYENDFEQHHEYWVTWTGESDYVNAAQTSYVSELGNLYIVISDTKKFENFFDKEEINYSGYMDYTFYMYDIPYENKKESD